MALLHTAWRRSTFLEDLLHFKRSFLARLREGGFEHSFLVWLGNETTFTKTYQPNAVSKRKQKDETLSVWQAFRHHPVLKDCINSALLSFQEEPYNLQLIRAVFKTHQLKLCVAWKLRGVPFCQNLVAW